jgi:predicted Fe-S protein YdhL (DUF1289 family)
MSSAGIIAETGIKSPCTRVCVVHPASQLCIGCGRSVGEIARWTALTDAERDRIMAQLPARVTAYRAGAVA